MYMYVVDVQASIRRTCFIDMSAKKYVGLLEREGGLDVLRHIVNLHGSHTMLYSTAKAVIDRSATLV